MRATLASAIAILTGAWLAGPACGRRTATDSEAAVRQALERYLASRPNLKPGGMDMQVTGILFRGQEAEADVTFRAKDNAQATMSIKYMLKRGEAGWEVGAPAAGHGGSLTSGPPAADLPPGHPPVKQP